MPWSCEENERVSAVRFFVRRAQELEPALQLTPECDVNNDNDPLSYVVWPLVFEVILRHFPAAHQQPTLVVQRGQLVESVGAQLRHRRAGVAQGLAGPAAAANTAENAAMQANVAAFAELPHHNDAPQEDAPAIPEVLFACSEDFAHLLALPCLRSMPAPQLKRLIDVSKTFFTAMNGDQPANPPLPDNVVLFDLDAEQQNAYDLLFTDSILPHRPLPPGVDFAGFDIRVLLGSAGSGKSQIINKAHRELGQRLVCLAFTGAAVSNVFGCTLHSFFGFCACDDDDDDAARNQGGLRALDGEPLLRLCEKLLSVTHIVIDEWACYPFRSSPTPCKRSRTLAAQTFAYVWWATLANCRPSRPSSCGKRVALNCGQAPSF